MGRLARRINSLGLDFVAMISEASFFIFFREEKGSFSHVSRITAILMEILIDLSLGGVGWR
jgi:hypothetical protein